MSNTKNEVIEAAVSDIETGKWKLADLLGLIYDHGRMDAVEQFQEGGDIEATSAGIVLSVLISAMAGAERA